MRFALITHVAKAANLPQDSAANLLQRHNVQPVGKLGFAFVYDADEVADKFAAKVGSLSDEESQGVVPLDRPNAVRCK